MDVRSNYPVIGSKKGVLHLGEIIPGLGKMYDILKPQHLADALSIILTHSFQVMLHVHMHLIIFEALCGSVIRTSSYPSNFGCCWIFWHGCL